MGKPDIFYVEDDEDFAFIMENAISEVKSDLRLSIVEDGTLAMDQLQKFVEERYKPRIILLDLNLPGNSGIDILRKIKEIPYLKHVPVILFSTSDNPKDVKASYEFGANAFITKPSGYTQLIDCVKALHDFWFVQNKVIN